MSCSAHRVLPVVRWLQVGVVAGGLGVAIAAAPALAWADDGATSAAADGGGQRTSTSQGSEVAHRSTIRYGGGATNGATAASAPVDRPGPARVTTRQRGSDLSADEPAAVAPVSSVRATSTRAGASSVVAPAPSAPVPVAANISAAGPSAPLSSTTTAPAPSASPGLGYIAATLRLIIEDVLTGTGQPVVTNPSAVVTGLFQEVLRRDPTSNELQNYLNRLTWWGVNSVVAGLYTSQEFRQNAVTNNYLKLLGRLPTERELSVGVLDYTLQSALGSPESYAASLDLAGGREFYDYSASGGGPNGSKPSATSYVNLLYRSFLGQKTDQLAPPPLIKSIQDGLPILLAANQFVRSDAYRTVTVGNIYQVLGYDPKDKTTEIDGYVQNWFWSGGQAGISQSLLATTANVGRIEAGQYVMPNMAAAGVLQQLLLAPYIDYVDPIKVPDMSKWGFNQLYEKLISEPYPPLPAKTCPGTTETCKDPAAYDLIKTGGTQRGIPNNSSSNTLLDQAAGPDPTKPQPYAAPFALKMNPTQNEINLDASLGNNQGPLRNADRLQEYFNGGVIKPFNNVVTADNGTYIVDGHHRWSAIYLINPSVQIVAQDLGYVPAPKVALKQAQFGVVADTGALKQSQAGAPNIYNVDELTKPVFNTKISGYILGPDSANPLPSANEVIATFGRNLPEYKGRPEAWNALDGDEKMTRIQDFIWQNVLLMREKNPPIEYATSRKVMPQIDDNNKVLNGLAGGSVIFSFPVISYLG